MIHFWRIEQRGPPPAVRSGEQGAKFSSCYTSWLGIAMLSQAVHYFLPSSLLNVSGYTIIIVNSIAWSYQIRLLTLGSWQSPLLDGTMRVYLSWFLNLSANKSDITWAVEWSCRWNVLCNLSRFFFFWFHSKNLCNELCTCLNSTFSLKCNDQLAGFICGDSNWVIPP